MRSFYTDLAMERPAAGVSGVRIERCRVENGIERCVVSVETSIASQALDKPIGHYITLSCEDMLISPPAQRERVAKLLSEEIAKLLPASGPLLVIGLGNRAMTADALGSAVADKVLVTRHMTDSLEKHTAQCLRSVSAVAPGVLGVTGLETMEVVRGLVAYVRPAAVIAVDALAAMDTDRICNTIQLSDSGITPGSGVANHRMGLNANTLGVPVIAVGAPMVVYGAAIVRDGLKLLNSPEAASEEEIETLAQGLYQTRLGSMVVTPRCIDEMVENMSLLIASGLNQALQPALSPEDISMMKH